MKTFKSPYVAQGDLNILAIDSIPEGLEECEKDGKGRYIVAHSETGHHHVMDGNTVRVFDADEFRSYADVQETTNVVHLRGFDTHEAIALPPGKYAFLRQREYTPEGYRRAAD